MTAAPDPPPIEPLFASSERLWLRVWAATQATALAVAAYVVLDRVGGLGALMASPAAARTLGTGALLVAYHAIGVRAHAWMLRRPWAVFLFVPLGWGLVFAALEISGAFGLLIFGAVIQGFLFLPFTWAIATLALAVAALVAGLAPRGRGQWTSLGVARVVGVVATGIMIGTVILYIHRANRDAAIRARLLRQLDGAQRDLAAQAREAGVQAERQRLAHDLHDTLAQGFTSVITHLEAAALSFGAAADPASDAAGRAMPHLAHAQAVSRASLAEIRRLVWALRPPQLLDAPLAAALARVVAQWSETHGVAASCALDPVPALHPDAEVVFLRATQESLSNVARHARAAHVGVALQHVDGLVLLTVEDDGAGFADPEAAGVATMGIAGMRERVRRFGGHVLIESAPGSGTSITVAMPLSAIAAPPA